MKTKCSIYFDAPRLPNGVRTILEHADCGPDVSNVVDGIVQDTRMSSAWLKLDDGDPRIGRVLRLLEQHGIEPDTYTFTEYSDDDLQSAVLLQMVKDPNVWVPSGPKYGTKYDMTNACPTCASGARQTSPLYVWWRHLKRIRQHRAIGCERGGIILDLGLENKLRAVGITGASFGDVYGRLENNKRTLVARQQILIENTLPPLSPTSEMDLAKICPTCHRGGIETKSDLRYRRKDLEERCDFNLTWEWFGWYKYDRNLKKAKLSTPRILVTPKVMNIFREANVTTFEWIPVFVDD